MQDEPEALLQKGGRKVGRDGANLLCRYAVGQNEPESIEILFVHLLESQFTDTLFQENGNAMDA